MEAESLFAKNVGLAHWLATKYARKWPDPSEWDDFHSEALLGLLRAAKTYRPDKGVKFATYAYVVITNQLLMWMRKAKDHLSLASLDELREGGRLHEATVFPYQSDLELTARELAPTFTAHVVDGLSYKQLAATLNISPRAAGARVQRQKEALQKHLAEEHWHESGGTKRQTHCREPV